MNKHVCFCFHQKQDKTFPSKSYFFLTEAAFCLIFCTKPTSFPFQSTFLISLNSSWLHLCRKRALLHDKRRLGHTGKLKSSGWITYWCKSETSQVQIGVKRGLKARSHTYVWICFKPAVAVVHFWIELSFTGELFINNDPGLTEFSKPSFRENSHLLHTFHYCLLTAWI